MAEHVFALVGEGMLADAVGARTGARRAKLESNLDTHLDFKLDSQLELTRDLARDHERERGSPVVLSISDTAVYPDVRKQCIEQRLSWLPVRVERGAVWIGPLEVAGSPGCVRCLAIRRSHARGEGGEALTSTPLGALACDTVAELVAAMPGPRCVTSVDIDTLEVRTHGFLPEPFCPDCGGLPDDSAEAARITLASRPKLAPATHRTRDLLAELGDLVGMYVDPEAGIIRALARDVIGGLVVASATMTLRFYDGAVEYGIGRTRSYRTSQLVAVLEALERYGGIRPAGKRTVVQGTYRELAARALDPSTLGTHPPESYALPDCPYRAFDADQRCRWVWGFSFARQEPILVPETVAYYRAQRWAPYEKPFFYELSNGCALGSCIEEAILHGILEVAERDAFLMTWYRQSAAPRVDLDTATDRAVPLQAAAIEAESGYRVHVFDITQETGIPCVWATATRQSIGYPQIVCAGASSLDPQRAVLNALSELGPILADMTKSSSANASRMAADASLVTEMLHHSELYGAPEAAERLAFLTEGTAVRAIRPMDSAFLHADLRDDLLTLIGRYARLGMDVIVIDQTTPEHRAFGLSCVKVLIPGTVPMTFGHANRRTHGLPRLSGELNPHPHPFP